MRRRKDWSEEWHHRVPDYRLVYCGPKGNSPEEETKKYQRLDDASTYTADEPEMEVVSSKRKRLKLSAKA